MISRISTLALAVAALSVPAGAVEPGILKKPAPAAKSTAQRPEYAKLIEEKANAIVTVKAVLQIKGGSGASNDRATEVEVPGVVIDASGLVLCSNTMLGGFAQRMGGGSNPYTVEPTNLKILVGNETEGLDAKLLARDSELDLAWLQIKSLGSKKLDALDPAKAVVPAAGDDLLTVQRMPKHYARLVVITEGRVAGVAQKPRSMVLATGDRGPGSPVFSHDGQFVGISTLLSAEDDDRRGARNWMSGRFNTIVLPAAEVVKATARAKEPSDVDGG